MKIEASDLSKGQAWILAHVSGSLAIRLRDVQKGMQLMGFRKVNYGSDRRTKIEVVSYEILQIKGSSIQYRDFDSYPKWRKNLDLDKIVVVKPNCH